MGKEMPMKIREEHILSKDNQVDKDIIDELRKISSSGGSGGVSGVSSFNGRTGVVKPAANDYSVEQISGLSAILSSKADQNTLESISEQLSSKASIESVQALQTSLASKVNTGDKATSADIILNSDSKWMTPAKTKDMIDAAKLVGGENTDSTIASHSNILINYWFKSPINQRKKSVYTNGYGIDRWINQGGSSTITLTEDGLHIISTQPAGLIFDQRLENMTQYEGQIMTASVLVKDLVSGTLAVQIQAGYNAAHGSSISTAGLLSVTGIYHSDVMQGGDNAFRLFNTEAPFEGTIVAAKLELGDYQTLAHQENGVWVLNDAPPDPALELARCQRYYRINNALCVSIPKSITEVTMYSKIPTDMRATPKFTDITFAASIATSPCGITNVNNIKATNNDGYVEFDISGMNDQSPGATGFGIVRGAWNAEL